MKYTCKICNSENMFLLFIHGEFICGECYTKFLNKQKEDFLKKIENATNTNSGN